MYIYIYIYIYIHVSLSLSIYIYIYIYIAASRCIQALVISTRRPSNRGSRTREPLIVLTSACPLTVQISQGLGPFFQIGLSKTDRSACEVKYPIRSVYNHGL